MYIAAQFLVHCSECGLAMDLRRPIAYQRCTGWVQNRQAGGGSHALPLMQRLDEWCCRICLDLKRMNYRSPPRPGGQADCSFCGELVQRRKLGTYQKCIGWTSSRSGTALLPDRLDEWACANCIDRQRQGISLDQGSLF